MRSFITLLVAGSLAIVAAGCGGGLDCGAGTHSAGGYCVQDNPMTCDTDTAELKDGVCVAKQNGGTCGPGTKVNPVNPDECIPDCGAGTSLDPVTKKCVPDDTLIQPNVIEKPSDEDNDPMNAGGVPIDITLPALAQSTIIAGVIAAPVADTDGVLWADWDGWKFSTTGPTLLEIEGLAVSHIRAAFWIAPADDVSLGGLERFGYDAEADQAHRKLFIPRSGDWVLMVSDAENFNAFWNGNDGGYATLVGSDDATYNYAVRITNLALPGFDNLAPATPMTGSYDNGPKFYSLAPTVGQVVEFWNIPGDANNYAVTDFFSPETTFRRTAYTSLALARGTSDTLYFVADLYGATGEDPSVTYEAKVMTPEDLGAITSTAVTKSGVAIATALESKYYKFTVSGDNIITINIAASSGANADFAPRVALYDSAMNPVFGLTGYPDPTFRPGTGTVEYILRVTDRYGLGAADYTFDLSVTAFAVTATAESEPNETAGTATAGTGFPLVFTGNLSSTTDKDYYSFTLPADGEVVILTTDPGAVGLVTALELYDSTATLVDSWDASEDLYCLMGYSQYCLAALYETGSYALTAGAYTIAVYGYVTGNYQVVVAAP
jgi:hypothetical protein